jgi:Ser/Thr protein kinase RdoA (MazF antagonist)
MLSRRSFDGVFTSLRRRSKGESSSVASSSGDQQDPHLKSDATEKFIHPSLPWITENKVFEDLSIFYNLTGKLKQLGSCQDINFRLTTDDNSHYIVKYLNKAISWEDIYFQHQVLDYLDSFQSSSKLFQIPFPIKRTDGENSTIVKLSDPNGDIYHLCVLSYIHGELLSDFEFLHPSALQELGKDIAIFNSLLSSFPLSDDYHRLSEWDLRKAYSICVERRSTITDTIFQEKLIKIAGKNNDIIQMYNSQLRHQLVHGDLADYNIIAERKGLNRPKIRGIIDFGDIVESWLVADIACCIVTLLSRKNQDCLQTVIEVIKGFSSHTPLNETELRALWHLIILRSILLVINVYYILEKNPQNDYLNEEKETDLQVLENILEIPIQYAVHSILMAGGIQVNVEEKGTTTSVPTTTDQQYLLANKDVNSSFYSINLSYENILFHNGNWDLERGIMSSIINHTIVEQSQLQSQLQSSSNDGKEGGGKDNNSNNIIYEIPYGVPWFTHSVVRSLESPKTIPTFSLFLLPKSTRILAPFTGTAKIIDDPTNIELLMQEIRLVKTGKKESRFGSFTTPKVLEFSNDLYTLIIFGLQIATHMSLTFENAWTINAGMLMFILFWFSFFIYDFVAFSFSFFFSPCCLLFPLSFSLLLLLSISFPHFPVFSFLVCFSFQGERLGEINSDPIDGNNYCPLFIQFFKTPTNECKIYPELNSYYPSLFVNEREWKIYSLYCLNPISLFPDNNSGGMKVTPTSTSSTASSSMQNVDSLIEKRLNTISCCQEYYYATSANKPPIIERGYREFLYDIYGRGYLDIVNNVAIVGHSPQRLAELAYEQLLKLNTNSRFLYSSLGNYSEKILLKIPLSIRSQGKLNRVFFVNSGSEATDLALRIARTVVTERRKKSSVTKEGNNDSSKPSSASDLCRDVLCIQGGYHGVTTASDEISTTLNDNPK